jgi:hypothetical protein
MPTASVVEAIHHEGYRQKDQAVLANTSMCRD